MEADKKDLRVPEPLTRIVFHILVALMDEERHGLGIMREVERRTGGEIWLSSGTLYPALKRLVEDGIIEESDERPAPDLDDRRRRYFRLTEFGARVLAAETERKKAEVRQVDVKRGLRGANPSPEGV